MTSDIVPAYSLGATPMPSRSNSLGGRLVELVRGRLLAAPAARHLGLGSGRFHATGNPPRGGAVPFAQPRRAPAGIGALASRLGAARGRPAGSARPGSGNRNRCWLRAPRPVAAEHCAALAVARLQRRDRRAGDAAVGAAQDRDDEIARSHVRFPLISRFRTDDLSSGSKHFARASFARGARAILPRTRWRHAAAQRTATAERRLRARCGASCRCCGRRASAS